MTDLTKTLKQLIRFKTISGLDHQPEVIKLYDYVNKPISTKKYSSQLINYSGFNNLVIEEKNNKKPNIILAAHVDVVPGSEDNFKPVLRNNKLYGRGASDMKFAIAVYVKLLQTLDLNNYSLKIILTSDEEIGGYNGVYQLHKNDFFKRSIAIILPDAGNNFDIINKSKGIAHIRLDAKGKSSHASRPFDGKNALDLLLQQKQILQDKLNIDNRAKWNNTLVVSKLYGGDVVNMVPDKASMWLDIRFIEKYTSKNITDVVKKSLIKDVKSTVLLSGEPVFVDSSNTIFKLLENNITLFAKKKISYGVDYGTTDARHLVNLRVPIIMIKPLSGGHHTQKEWVDINSLKKYYLTLRSTLIDFDNLI